MCSSYAPIFSLIEKQYSITTKFSIKKRIEKKGRNMDTDDLLIYRNKFESYRVKICSKEARKVTNSARCALDTKICALFLLIQS